LILPPVSSPLFPYTTLFRSLYRIRSFLLFVFLEGIAIWFIVSFNSPQGAVFFNSSNQISGRFLTLRDNVMEYFYLSSANDALARSEEHTSELQSRENLVCRL